MDERTERRLAQRLFAVKKDMWPALTRTKNASITLIVVGTVYPEKSIFAEKTTILHVIPNEISRFI